MTPAGRRLAALAAALAPGSAARLVARGPEPDAAAEVKRISMLSRAERLRALSTALAGEPPAEGTLAAAIAGERARLAALLAGAPGPPSGVAPFLARLLRDRRR